MTADHRAPIEIDAPAKLNLGLEIVGRRDDGYHEIATILQAVSILDRVTVAADAALRLVCDDPSLADDNLAMAALVALQRRADPPTGAALSLLKGIPIAAGLGGASSDAAAALLAGSRLWNLDLGPSDLAEIAAALGSDVPFFLRGGAALAIGRGERLAPLPPPSGVRFVVVSPTISLPRKTATLYAALTPEDRSDGARVKRQADNLRAGRPLDPDLLGNAFARPLSLIRSEVAELPDLMRTEGATAVGLSGAGPSHYALLDDPDRATWLAGRLAERLASRATVTVAFPWPGAVSTDHPSQTGDPPPRAGSPVDDSRDAGP